MTIPQQKTYKPSRSRRYKKAAIESASMNKNASISLSKFLKKRKTPKRPISHLKEGLVEILDQEDLISWKKPIATIKENSDITKIYDRLPLDLIKPSSGNLC